MVDGNFDGKSRKMLMQASRNGYYFVLDRVTGESLLTVPFGPTNWTLGVDKQGRPIPDPKKEPAPDGRFIAPDEGGMTNYRSPSFDPKTGLFLVDAHHSYSIYFFAKPADGTWAGRAGADYGLWGNGSARGDRLPDWKVIWLEPRTRTRRFRRRRPHHGLRPRLHRGWAWQHACSRYQRRQNSLARRIGRSDAKLSHHLHARRAAIRADRERERAVCLETARRAMRWLRGLRRPLGGSIVLRGR